MLRSFCVSTSLSVFLKNTTIKLSPIFYSQVRSFPPAVIEAMKQPNKVVNSYIDECILSMIRSTKFKSCIPIIVAEIKEIKSKIVRENCLEYLSEILLKWNIQEKETDIFEDAIKLGLEEASVRGREIARVIYLNFHIMFPKKAERIKNKLSSALASKLSKAEAEYKSEVSSVSAGDVISDSAETSGDTTQPSKLCEISNMLMSPKPTLHEVAVTSIQALIRGNYL